MRVVVRAARSRELAFGGASVLGLLLATAVIGSHEQALWATGEAWPLDEVVKRQRQTGALFQREYASANTIPAYKFRALQNAKPRVAVLGSMRMAGLRPALLGEPGRFYNAAGLIQGLGDLQAVLDRIPADSTPRVVVIGLDPWWFGYRWPLEATDWNRDPDWGWLAEGNRIASSLARPWLLLGAPADARHPSIGLAALRSGEGFRSDGSQVRADSAGRRRGEPFVDTLEPTAVARVTTATVEFEPSPGVSRERIQRLGLVLRQFRDRGVLVIGVAPPLATAAVDALEASEQLKVFWHEFRDQSKTTFRYAGFPFLDASDPRALGLDDRAMNDGFQAGDGFWVAVLDRLSKDRRVAAGLPGMPATVAALASKVPSGQQVN
ncbi:MAG: hypothetical protein R2729_28210 [Bryobacteraceae bacterium]